MNVDDFCQTFLPAWEQKLLANGSKKRCRTGQLSISEILTLLIYFHQSQYRNFKAYYIGHACKHLRAEFPNLVTNELCNFDAFRLWTLECLLEKLIRTL